MMNYDDPSASERIVPAVRWRAPHGTHTARYHHQPVFLSFLSSSCVFLDVRWFFSSLPSFFLESRRRRFHITRARSPCFILFLFFFDFIASPLVRTGHHSRGSQQQHALTFIQMGTIRYSPAFHLFYLWCYDDDQSRKKILKIVQREMRIYIRR